MMSLRKLILCLGVALALLGREAGAAEPSKGARRSAEAKDMALVGYHDLQARSAYQPVIQHQGDRFIAYIGHHGGTALNPLTGKTEPNGASIVDVTDPRKPRYLHHIPGSAEGSGEAGKTYLLRTLGNQGHQVWDVTDPSNPTFVSTVVSGLTTTFFIKDAAAT